MALDIDSIIRAEIPEITLINLSYGSEEEASFASMMNSTGNNILSVRLRTLDLKNVAAVFSRSLTKSAEF